MRLASFALVFCGYLAAQPSEYNQFYREERSVFRVEPNAFLVDAVRGRKPGRALDVGMGQGRNSIYLAKLGWDVTGFDSADEGVRRAKAEAERLGLKMRAEVNTFDGFDFGREEWDLIVLTYEPTKTLAPRVPAALKPGGLVVVEDRHLDTKRVWPAGTFGDNELLTVFPGLRVLRYEDVWARPDWSAKGVEERLVRMLAEKPAPRAAGCVWEGATVAEGDSVCWETAVLRCRRDGWLFTREKCQR
jgi:SAM-dependent methyltransferase